MSRKIRHISFGWLVLCLVGISITFSTLHSHHEVDWNHTTQHSDSEHCITNNTNVCPICGYLFNASVVNQPTSHVAEKPTGFVSVLSNSQLIDPFTGKPAGRSPPAVL